MVLPLTGWIEEDAKEEEEDPKEDPEEDPEEELEDDDDDIEMDDETEVIDPYIDDGSNNPPPPNSKDEETPHTSLVIPDADGKMEKIMSERIDTEGRIKKKFKEQDHHFVGVNYAAQKEYKRKPTSPVDTGYRAVGLIRWIEKTEMVFTVATLGIEVVTRKTWVEMKVMITEEFCPSEEIQRMEATLNKAVRMAHTLMEQKVKAIAEREADNKKRKWENFQGGSSSGGGNNNSNWNNNNYNGN
nr:hypothetical protein [Tanacetum cinerariifolium]